MLAARFRKYRGKNLALAALLAGVSCTKLESKNDAFDLASAGGSNTSGGAASGGSGDRASGGGNSNTQGGVAKSSGGSNSGGLSDSAGSESTGTGGRSGSDGGSLGTAGASGAGGESCIDETGFHGLGCGTCPGTDIVSLENACSRATCTPFDDIARLPALGSDGKLPALPTAGGAAASGGAGGNAAQSAGGGAAGAGKGGASLGGGGNTSSAGGGSAGRGGATTAGGASSISCGALAENGSVVVVAGSSAAKPYLQQIARQLAEQSIYLVYTSTGSCVGVDAIVNATPLQTGASPAPATSATYWDSASSTGKACDWPAPGVIADIGVSDVFAQTCPGFELTNLDSLQVRDAHGPIQTMGFAVPANSMLSEISARAAYLVFGLGADGGVLGPDGATPIWNDERYIFQRSATSGTQALLAAAIGVPSANFRGKPHKSSDEVASDLLSAGATQATANQAIGILAADYIDTQSLRAQIRVLAYQDTHQACAMYPDSAPGARDKQNVRDGHYPLWGPLHLMYKVDGAGAPANAKVRQQIQDIVGYLTGSKALPNGVRLIDVYAQSGLVPECAMRVSRSNDGGNLMPFTPENPCSCLYDAVATGATDCTPCSLRGDCKTDETCSFGYCQK
ncbi:MAG TPA: hypothetical protein VG937_31540 [Polyangiaceae bacterium]|nr:hypothetical protein [Polyangiaceae bacterium]